MPGTPREARGLVIAGAALGLAAAVGVAVLIYFDSVPPERGLHQLALPLVCALPALLGLASLWSRPALLLPAAALSFLLAFGSFSGVGLVLLVPCGLYVLAFRRQRGLAPPMPLRRAFVAVVVPVLAGMAAFVALFATEDPLCWEYVEDAQGGRRYTTLEPCPAESGFGSLEPPPAPGTALPPPGPGGAAGGGGTSNRVSAQEAAASAALVALGLAAAVGVGAQEV